MKQASLKSILVLCPVHAIADTFRSAVTAADLRINVVVYANSAEYLADPRADRAIQIAVILTSGDTIMIGAMSLALYREGITRTLAVYLGSGPTPQGSTFTCLPPEAGFDTILAAVQNMLGLRSSAARSARCHQRASASCATSPSI